jgi:hypothetical protein
MIGGGVPSGAISAVHAPLATAGKPISGIAGTSGNSGARFGPTIASASNLPPWMSCSEVLTVCHLNLASHDRCERRPAALVGNMQDICAARRLEQLGIEMWQRADAAGRVIELAWIGLCVSDELRNRFERQLWFDHVPVVDTRRQTMTFF